MKIRNLIRIKGYYDALLRMNSAARLIPIRNLHGAHLQLKRAVSISNCVAAKKIVKPYVPSKTKSKQPLVKVWNGITISQLADATKRPLDDVFEAILMLPSGDAYARSSDLLSRDDCFKILKLLGCRGEISPAPSSTLHANFLANEHCRDATRQPAAPPDQLRPRRAVVTVMGHVDHGKTTLLDSLRKTRIVDEEFGGITQHIGTFSVPVPQCPFGAVTFLDTPGHAAFAAMRARGANVTDVVILVVAADDGVMEQTVESIRFAKEADVPLIVAVNKMDKHGASMDRVKQGLLAHGIQADSDGGETQFVPISALKGEGLDKLLESVTLQGELLELKASYQGLAEGYVIESSLHEHRGKLCTILIDRGVLRKGNIVVVGTTWCKVRTLFDERGKPLSEVEPGCAAQITGWRDLPNAGELALEVTDEKRAKEVVQLRNELKKHEKAIEEAKLIEERSTANRIEYRRRLEEKWALGYQRKMRATEPRKKQVEEDIHPAVRLVIKGDTDGSVEALLDVLATYDQDRECRLDVVHYGVGSVCKNDIELADAFQGLVYAMHVSSLPDAKLLAKEKQIQVKEFKVIYHLIDDVKKEISSRLPMKEVEEHLGEATVLQEFLVTDSKKKVPVAGVRCIKGELRKNETFKLIRDGHTIFSGSLSSMRHLKNEVASLKKDVEGGLMLSDTSIRISPGDTIICVKKFEIPQKTSWAPRGF